MNILVTLLIYIVFFCIIWLVMNYILKILEVQAPIVNIIKAIVLIIILIILLGLFFGGSHLELPRIR